jgi:isochorismate synthase
MKINKNTSKIYVGGGITKDSIPDNEWTETQNKAMILGRFF